MVRDVVLIIPPKGKAKLNYRVSEKVSGVKMVYRYATKAEADKHKMKQKVLKGGFL